MKRTASKWVDPSKRLPRSLKPVLFVEKSLFHEEAVVGCYDSTYKCWTILEYGYSTARSIPTENVRCWMPKPKPPRKRKPAKANGGADLLFEHDQQCREAEKQCEQLAAERMRKS